MRNLLSSLRAGFRRCLLLPLLLAAVLPARAVTVDLNSDGFSDIWALKYGVTSFSLTADSDGDGLKDAAEAAAGTDPFNANSTVLISAMTQDVDGQHFTFPTLLGKGYLLQKSPALSPAGWVSEGTAKPGTGEALTVTIPAAGAAQYFYRVVVQDMDSDGDGVNDWEEITLGFDPKNAYTNGLSAANDLTTITAALGATNEVTVSVTDSSAVEPAVGAPSTQTGAFQIRRTGNLNAITVAYSVSGSAVNGTDYQLLTGTVALGLGVNIATVTIAPSADAAVESPESVVLTVGPSAAYTVGTPAFAALLIQDFATATGTGLRANFYNEATTLHPGGVIPPGVAPAFGTVAVTRIDPVVNYTWASSTVQGTGSPAVGVNVDYFASRWTGEVLPAFSQIYTFEVQFNRCARLWVNGQLLINRWPGNGDNAGGANRANDNPSATVSATIELVAGVRVPIRFEQFETTGSAEAQLRWSSTNLTEETIPMARLFPDTAPQITSATSVLLVKNGPLYNYTILASGSPTGFSALNLPPGWSVHPTSGVISGIPNVAGHWDVVLTATNAYGSGSAMLDLTVVETGGEITRDVWSGTYADLSALPLATAPASTAPVTVLEGPLAPGGGDYGARLRGYLTAPQTGVYKFWITGSDSAELWISDDDEPVNLFRRASTTGGTSHRGWTDVNAGKSPLLFLHAGQRYAVEVRHVDTGANGHVSVGWLKPSATVTDPANVAAAEEVVPGYVLSPYVVPAVIDGQSTLFATSMTAQGVAVTSGYGSASLRLSADESQAILVFSHANLTSPLTGQHIHAGSNTEIIFDIDTAPANGDGSHTWHIGPVGAFTAEDIRNMIKAGDTYINIHTAIWPQGEIKGFLKLQAASQTFTPPPPQTWTDPNSASNKESALHPNGASRFLIQSTFGPSAAEIANVQAMGSFEAWINDQISKPATLHYPYVFANRTQTDPNGNTYFGELAFNSWWRNAVTAPDQLRQRIAFALSEIFVVSENGPLDNRADTLSDFYDMLLANAFGNVRTLLEDVTLHPGMGRYLDMLNNRKPNLSTGRIPNENYAREIKQLFSIGLYRMHPDGSLMLNSKGELIPTYDQDAIIGFAHVFTGWGYNYAGAYRTTLPSTENWINPMREVPLEHFTGQKRLLNNVVLPGLAMVGGQPLDPNATHGAAQYDDPAYQALAGQELDAAHDALFNHPNTGPFLCRQLIQRLVTSTPSRGYLYRVVQKFNDNGSGVRGDMVAIVKAILLDHEARSASLLSQQGYGKQREPLSRVAAIARAFPAPPPVTGTYVQVGNLITVTTGAPHFYGNTQSAFLDFSAGVPSDPDDAAYVISNATANSFTVRPLTSQGVTYSQTGGTITVTETDQHNYNVGNSVYLDFTSGAPDSPVDGFYTVATENGTDTIFTVNMPTTKTATYSQTGSVITCTSTAHGFASGASLYLAFTSGTPSAQTSGLFTVDTAADANTFTVIAADAVDRTGAALATPAADAASRTGSASMTKVAYAANRTGSVAVNYSDWEIGNTDTALGQTPLNSPTVFNFFLPDYQFPGILGAAGLITPEFEITSETTVIRQSNFLYDGIFNDALGQIGITSFRSNARDIFLDLRPWMGIGPGGKPWAHNDNVDALIDELNTLLMAGQLPSTGTNNYVSNPRVIVNAKDAIRNYVVTQAATKAVTGTSAAAVTSLTVTGHGLTTGASVTIAGVTGGAFAPSINAPYTITVTGPNTFTVPVTCTNSAGANLTAATATPAGGSAAPISGVVGHTTVSVSAHGLAAGQSATISGVTGGNFTPSINGTFTLYSVTTNSFTVPVTRINGTGVSYASAISATGNSINNSYPDLLRDRVRSIVHLLITSPDFTIQK